MSRSSSVHLIMCLCWKRKFVFVLFSFSFFAKMILGLKLGEVFGDFLQGIQEEVEEEEAMER